MWYTYWNLIFYVFTHFNSDLYEYKYKKYNKALITNKSYNNIKFY